jgi:hypothetical protein
MSPQLSPENGDKVGWRHELSMENFVPTFRRNQQLDVGPQPQPTDTPNQCGVCCTNR